MCMSSFCFTRPRLGLHLQSARTALRRAQKATQESFATYTASLEAERRVSHEVAALEDKRDHLCNYRSPFIPVALPHPVLMRRTFCLVSLLLRQNQRPQSASSCPFPGCACVDGVPDGVPPYPRKGSTYESEHPRFASYSAPPPLSLAPMPIPPMRPAYAWDDRDREEASSPHTSSASASAGGSPARKHARTWDSEVSLGGFGLRVPFSVLTENRRTLRSANVSPDPCRTRTRRLCRPRERFLRTGAL